MLNPEFFVLTLSNALGVGISPRRIFCQIAEIIAPFEEFLFDFFYIETSSNLTPYQRAERLGADFGEFFWLFFDPKTAQIAGFAYLYDVVGSQDKNFGAKITFCFRRNFWGDFALACAKHLHSVLFGDLGFLRIYAEVFASNRLPRRFLGMLGFKKCGKIPLATLRMSRCEPVLADLDLFVLTQYFERSEA